MALSPSDDSMLSAWLGCLHWALGEQEVRGAFYKASGLRWEPPRSPIERMVDEATGADGEYLVAFAVFVNREIWGEVAGRACNGNEQELQTEPPNPRSCS
jgi:hypothetical protein